MPKRLIVVGHVAQQARCLGPGARVLVGVAQRRGGGDMRGIGHGHAPGLAARVLGEQPPTVSDPDDLQVGGHLPAGANCARVDRVVVGVDAHVVVPIAFGDVRTAACRRAKPLRRPRGTGVAQEQRQRPIWL